MPAQGQQQEADNSLGPVWIAVGIFVLGGFIWYFFSAYIIGFIFSIRMMEAELVGLFIPSHFSHHLTAIEEFIQTSKQSGYEGITFTELMNVSNAVGDFIRYPIMIILVVLAAFMYLTNPLSRFKRIYTMKQLLETQKDVWPQVMPISHLNLLNIDIDEGPWAMAMSPMGFAKKYKLLIYERPKNQTRLEARKPQIASINRDAARRIFAMQLGRYWSRPEALPIHARALYAVFSARVNGDRDSAWQLLEHIARSSAHGKPNFSGTDELLKKHKDNNKILRLAKRHSFELTILASMLEFARQDGVVACADFLWLKPMDRKLWYMLNCVGRQTPFAEVAGPFAHWIAEKEFGKRLNVPMIEEAVNGLEKVIKELIYKPEEEGD